MTISLLPKLRSFPRNPPIEGAVRMELVEGVPIFRASSVVQIRIEALLIKQNECTLNIEEEDEVENYERNRF